MKLVGRIPVEPLDDERMTNIERKIVAGAADAARGRGPLWSSSHWVRKLGFGIAGGALVACAVLVAWTLGSERAAPGVAVAPVRVDSTTDHTMLDIGDARITSGRGAVFVVTRPDGGVLVDLARGRVELDVGKRGRRAPLVVRAGATDVVVVGTRFSVDYGAGRGDAVVQVSEGVVRVRHGGSETRLAAGESWDPRRGIVAISETTAPAPGTSPDVRGSRATPGSVDAADDEIEIAPGSARGDGTVASGGYVIDERTAPDVLRDRTARAPTAEPRPAEPVTSAQREPTTSTRATTRREEVVLAPDPKDPRGDVRRAVRDQPLVPALDVGTSVAATAVAEYYGIIREQRGEREATAYYSIAVTQYRDLKRREDALKTIDTYFRRFGAKVYPEHRAAMWLRVRILCERAIDASCKQAAARYVKSDPDSAAGAIANRILLSN